jgi:PAS domain S-box-containing protein
MHIPPRAETLELLATIVLLCVVAVAAALRVARRSHHGLQIDQIDRLRRAELSLASAGSFEAAARELSEHAIALLGARSAVVLIEGQGDTVRVTAGDPSDQTRSVYGAGSRMRLLEDAGVPCGSIAVSARADGRAYEERDERILEALAQRVSSTLHRLSLFDAVRNERRILADVLESSSDGIFSVGADLQVRSWNPAMETITGVASIAAVGRHCCSVFRPHDQNGEPRFGSTCPGRNGASALVLRIETGAGTVRWLDCTFSPLSGGGYVGIARDVTAQKEIEDEKADFLATVSHELRTPLTPIKGFLQTLIRRDGDFAEADRRHLYEVMLREEQRLERLVHQLLQATSLDHPDRLVVPEVLDWVAVAGEQLESFRRQDPLRDWELLPAPDVPSVVADEQLACQVLANLLSNAAKYSPEGAPVRVSIEREGDTVKTTVLDRGPGVAAADRERIFDKFTRLGDHLTRSQPGVGLGLYIARRSVDGMDGDLWVAPGPEGGAAFSFTLPVHEAAAARPARTR